MFYRLIYIFQVLQGHNTTMLFSFDRSVYNYLTKGIKSSNDKNYVGGLTQLVKQDARVFKNYMICVFDSYRSKEMTQIY